MKQTRVNEIMNRMTAFENDKYTRDEMLNEFFKLQKEMATIAFGETLSEEKRFYDISDHYSDKNRRNNRVSAQKMETFRKECGAATNYIKAEISGRKGESKAFYKLNYLLSTHSLRKNVEISNGNRKTEIDILVVTEKAAFIIEVKNTKRDIFIDEHGQYYRTGEFLKWDSDIGSKLAMREEFVKIAAEKAGIKNLKVEKVVVFTDNRVRVQNKCKSIRTCFLSQLTSVIDTYRGEKALTLENIETLLRAVDEMTTNSSYVPEIDINKFKADFAEIVATMDYETTTEPQMVWLKTWRTLVSSLTLRRVASLFLTIGTVAAIVRLV
ncbi:MAG: NERD domain-containing protein [Clostridiales bacterium]|nr:NERD domain-containing protein [Clostridiales bacterium]